MLNFKKKYVKKVADNTKSRVENINIYPYAGQEGLTSLVDALETKILAQASKSEQFEKEYQAVEEKKRAFELSTTNLKAEAVANVCDKYTPSTSYFNPAHSSRSQIVSDLRDQLQAATSKEQVVNALVAAARDIRTPDSHGYLKYGCTFFRSIHIGKYENSSLYKLIDSRLKTIYPDFNLAYESEPLPPVRYQAAGLGL